jgi:hypothetical protein
MSDGRALEAADSGVYVAPQDPAALRARAARSGLAWLDLATAGARSKQAFLACCAAQLGFPDGFGDNWDALADCVRDFSWRNAPGYVILWRGGADLAAGAPEAFAVAIEVWREAAGYWKKEGKPFLVLLDRPPAGCALQSPGGHG